MLTRAEPFRDHRVFRNMNKFENYSNVFRRSIMYVEIQNRSSIIIFKKNGPDIKKCKISQHNFNFSGGIALGRHNCSSVLQTHWPM